MLMYIYLIYYDADLIILHVLSQFNFFSLEVLYAYSSQENCNCGFEENSF